MLTLNLGTIEYFDSETNQFDYEEGGIVRFEYTLKVMYDWEAKWKKPFLRKDFTTHELIDFYKMMALDPVDDKFITDEVATILTKYISNADTATTFSTADNGQNGNNGFTRGKIYTAEEIYALMFAANVPLEFENRNLNRLFVILRIMSSHNSTPKKMSKQDIYKQNANLNAQRKAMMKTKG